MRDRFLTVLAQIVLFSIPSVIILEYPPKYTWDMVAYIGVAASYFESGSVEIHETVYRQLREGIPREAFKDLIAANRYQAAVYENAAHFIDQLPFYRVKPLYPALMAALHGTGLSLPDAQIAISKLSVILTMVAAYFWFLRYTSRLGSSLSCCFFFSFLPVAEFSGWLTPDPLFMFLIVTYCLVVVLSRNEVYSLLLGPVLILCRPDSMIFLLLIASYFLWRGRHRKLAAAMSVVVVSQYLIQALLSDNYGWTTLFYHSFIEPMADPGSVDPRLTLTEYASIYARNLASPDTVAMSWWVALGLAAALCYRRVGARENVLGHLVLLISAYCALHWLAFPTEKDRLLFPAYMLTAMLVVSMLLQLCAARARAGRPG